MDMSETPALVLTSPAFHPTNGLVVELRGPTNPFKDHARGTRLPEHGTITLLADHQAVPFAHGQLQLDVFAAALTGEVVSGHFPSYFVEGRSLISGEAPARKLPFLMPIDGIDG